MQNLKIYYIIFLVKSIKICTNEEGDLFLNFLNNLILSFNDFIWTYILIGMLIIIGLYFTFKTKFVQFKNIKDMFSLLSDGNSTEKNSV